MRYGLRLGCRFGQPHDMKELKDTPAYKVERCGICGIRKRWNKGYKQRIKNAEYLKFHLRNYAQRGGATRGVYMKLYQPEKTVIVV